MEAISTQNTFLAKLIVDNYPRIKTQCQFKAFKFHIAQDDLLSEINNSLMRAVSKNQFAGNEEDFFKYLNLIIHNCAINVYRGHGVSTSSDKQIDKFMDFEEIREFYTGIINKQPDLDEKFFVKMLCSWVSDNLHMKSKGKMALIFQMYFLNGCKYEEISIQTAMPIGSVKTAIHRIRQIVAEKFGDTYNELYKSA